MGKRGLRLCIGMYLYLECTYLLAIPWLTGEFKVMLTTVVLLSKARPQRLLYVMLRTYAFRVGRFLLIIVLREYVSCV